ncbi:MAG: hypothetical protein JSU00_14435 [Acidobacteria bacterium]|nr:hypothetical protein [Acidobacteriota bacterium]
MDLFTTSTAARRALLLCLFATLLVVGQTSTTPSITATPAVLNFAYQIGATTMPAAQSVAFKSTTAGLAITLSVAGDPPSNGNWVTTSIRAGVAASLPASVTVTVTPTGLAAGNYTAVITASANTQSGTITQSVSVTLSISPPASTLHVSPSALSSFNYTTGGTPPTSQQFLLYSDGSPMSVTVSVASAPWLKLSPTGSIQLVGLTKPIQVSIDPIELSKLAPKTYTANVTITAPTATNKSITYPVTLVVRAAPPVITGTWPDGVVMSSASSGTTTIVVNGTSFFSTSTIAVSGFTNSSTIKVADGSSPPITASETVSVPVYSTTATGLRTTFGSPLPTGFTTLSYFQDLSPYVSGGTGPYTWSATNLPSGFSMGTDGLLSCIIPVAGNYTFNIAVTDSVGAMAYQPVNLTVYPGAMPSASEMWVTVPAIISAATVGTAYNLTLVAIGGSGTYAWSLDSTTPLPTGLTMVPSGSAATVSGTPTTSGITGMLTAKLLSDGAMQVGVPNSYLNKIGMLRLAVSTPTPGGGVSNDGQLLVYGPEPRILGVANAASYAAGTVAPGELITIFGTGLGPSAMAIYDPNSATLPQNLPNPAPVNGGTQVLFKVGINQVPAALLYAASGQVGAMVPFEVSGQTSVQMTVVNGALSSKTYTLAAQETQPGIFTVDGSGRGQGAILNYNATTGDYVVNSSSNTAAKGSIVVLYITGFGVTNPVSGSYQWAASGIDTASPVTVTIDGKTATTTSAVPPGSFPGVLQINATVPTDSSTGKSIPVTVSVGGVSAQSGVTMGVK